MIDRNRLFFIEICAQTITYSGNVIRSKGQGGRRDASVRSCGEGIHGLMDEKRARGRYNLLRRFRGIDWFPGQEAQGRRGGQGKKSVIAGHGPPEPWQGGAGHACNAKPRESPEGADHVDDRIQRPDFVEMNLFERDGMRLAFRFAKEAQGGHASFLDIVFDIEGAHNVFHFREMPQGLAVRQVNVQGGSRDAVHPAFDRGETDIQIQGLKSRFQRADVKPQSAQARQKHVAADAADRVEMKMRDHGSVSTPKIEVKKKIVAESGKGEERP